MLDRMSGKILHIDFGDCFEVRKSNQCGIEKSVDTMSCSNCMVHGFKVVFRINLKNNDYNSKISAHAITIRILYFPTFRNRQTLEEKITKLPNIFVKINQSEVQQNYRILRRRFVGTFLYHFLFACF